MTIHWLNYFVRFSMFHFIQKCIGFLLLVCPLACITDQPLRQGTQPEYQSFIPARIAVLECHNLKLIEDPTAKTLNLAIDTVKPLGELCENFDAFVIKGFSDQPFMNGYEPSLVKELLAKKNQSSLFNLFDSFWKVEVSTKKIENLGLLYHQKISSSIPWRQWLNQFSQNTQFSDGLLIPFVLSSGEEKLNDRGLLASKRFAHLALLLIDANTGHLIWFSEHMNFTQNQATVQETSKGVYPEFPAWSLLFERLFIEAFWDDFPGRKVF